MWTIFVVLPSHWLRGNSRFIGWWTSLERYSCSAIAMLRPVWLNFVCLSYKRIRSNIRIWTSHVNVLLLCCFQKHQKNIFFFFFIFIIVFLPMIGRYRAGQGHTWPHLPEHATHLSNDDFFARNEQDKKKHKNNENHLRTTIGARTCR